MEKEMGDSIIACKICRKQAFPAKRCVRCRSIYYCSRECQVMDWPSHREVCQHISLNPSDSHRNETDDLQSKPSPSPSISSKDNKVQDDKVSKYSIMSSKSLIQTDCAIKPGSSNNISKDIFDQCNTDNIESDSGFETKHDQPTSNSSSKQRQAPDSLTVTVQSGRVKLRVQLEGCWSGEEMIQHVAKKINKMPDKLKLICKGKLVNAENVKVLAAHGATFLAIGEQVEDEAGIEKVDIDIVVRQLHVERNVAVRALKETGNVIDAMLYIANK